MNQSEVSRRFAEFHALSRAQQDFLLGWLISGADVDDWATGVQHSQAYRPLLEDSDSSH